MSGLPVAYRIANARRRLAEVVKGQTAARRQQVADILARHDGKPPRGAFARISEQWGVSRPTICGDVQAARKGAAAIIGTGREGK